MRFEFCASARVTLGVGCRLFPPARHLTACTHRPGRRCVPSDASPHATQSFELPEKLSSHCVWTPSLFRVTTNGNMATHMLSERTKWVRAARTGVVAHTASH